MKLVPIQKYDDYRLDVIFNGYKWDPQFTDNNTIARYALVISENEADELMNLTEKLSFETIAAENALNKSVLYRFARSSSQPLQASCSSSRSQNIPLCKRLALPRQLKKPLAKMADYNASEHVRLMRFDFHPLESGGYAVSEVNSDVPGGFAEASLMPKIAMKYLEPGNYRSIDFGEKLASAIQNKVNPSGTVAFVHCTSYSDDRQVMQFLGDKLEGAGYNVLYLAADHLKFENRKAVSVLNGKNMPVDFIFRFTPLEWMIGIKPKTWHGYFDTLTPSCNHPAVIYTQTKRLPLVFDGLEKLGVDLSAWKALLPETLDVKRAKNKEGFIFKPACGRVGESISIKSACSEEEYKNILKNVKKHPKEYLAQKMFISRPLIAEDGTGFHVCLGSYSVDGEATGFYARISKTRRIDSNSADIPVLIEGMRE